jgi:hypothetical protein
MWRQYWKLHGTARLLMTGKPWVGSFKQMTSESAQHMWKLSKQQAYPDMVVMLLFVLGLHLCLIPLTF